MLRKIKHVMLDTPWLKFSANFVECHRPILLHGRVVRLGRLFPGYERDGDATSRTTTRRHPPPEICWQCVWRPCPSLSTCSTQSDAHTQTELHPVYLSFRASELSEFVCMFSLFCHCIAPPLNLKIQSMLILDKKQQERVTYYVCFSRKWAGNLDVPCHNIEDIDHSTIYVILRALTWVKLCELA